MREWAARSLGRVGDNTALGPLAAVLTDDEGEVAEWAARSLGDLGKSESTEAVVHSLTHQNPAVREWSARSLGRIGGDRAVDGLIGTLQDTDRDVREWAVRALGDIGDPRAAGRFSAGQRSERGRSRVVRTRCATTAVWRQRLIGRPLLDIELWPPASVTGMENQSRYLSPLTVEEFAQLDAELQPLELVRGWVVREPVPTSQHGAICVTIAGELYAYAKRTGNGRVFGNDTGFILSRNPDTVRGPDVAFVGGERCHELAITPAWIDGPPDLAVEVLSPSERSGRIEKKVEDYLGALTPVIWLVQPGSRSVTVIEKGATRVLLTSEVLACEEHLPGFALRVCDIFV